MIKKIHREIHKQFDEEIQDIKEKRWKDILFERPLFKFIIFLIAQFLISSIASYFPGSIIIRWTNVIVNIGITVYFISMIIYVVKRSIVNLMRPKSISTLIGSYVLVVLALIILFSTLFNVAELTGMGYLKYGNCQGTFNPEMISTDPNISQDFFYFTSITFFTVGYGDICPMGISRIISILAAFAAHLVSVILVALIVNNYLHLRREKK
ncbi:MAG: ion channel [Candidatus Woesearchaeota archaeon]|jgi:potassium channel LctB